VLSPSEIRHLARRDGGHVVQERRGLRQHERERK